MKKLIIGLVILLAIVIALTAFFSFRNSQKDGASPIGNAPTATPTPVAARPREFVMYVKNWEFEPNVIRLKKGDRVTLRLKSLDVKHGFSQPDYNLSASLEPFKFVTLEFIANKTGEFQYICTLNCGPAGYDGMRGVIIVE